MEQMPQEPLNIETFSDYEAFLADRTAGERLDSLQIAFSSWYESYKEAEDNKLQKHAELDEYLSDLATELRLNILELGKLPLKIKSDTLSARRMEFDHTTGEPALFERIEKLVSQNGQELLLDYAEYHLVSQDSEDEMPTPRSHYGQPQLYVADFDKGVAIPIFGLIKGLEEGEYELGIPRAA